MSKILFIHPGNHRKTYQDLGTLHAAIAPPVWVGLLADHISRYGIECTIYDTNVEGWSREQCKDVLEKHNPELIVMMVYGHNPSASTQTMPVASAIAADIKAVNGDIPLGMGGLHPSVLPEKTLREESCDYVLRGEGAIPIRKLYAYLSGEIARDELVGVNFLEKSGDMFDSGMPPMTEGLDKIYQSYAFELLPDLSRYRAHNSHCFQEFEKSAQPGFVDVRTPYFVLYTSLGCPYNCTYCCTNSVFGKPRIRYWDLETVMGWIDTLVLKHGVKHIRLDDELFILSSKRVELFCDMIIERGYDLNLWAYARVDTINNRLLKKMKQAGLQWLCLGIEAGSVVVRNDVGKNIKRDIFDTVKIIQDNDIYVLGNFMFGLPEDNIDTMSATLDMAIKLRCEFINFNSTMAYPGSQLYDHWVATAPEKLPSSWAGYIQHGYEAQPLPTKYLTSEQVLEFRDEAFNEYYANEDYLKFVEQRFGPKTVEHICEMTKIKLKRKILGD
jgi:anaerobic magnesium-protoporphyrin IX monomethyl ester cyclase